GQPATFSGAVGQFDIFASAKPVDVSVGDPITLTVTITDNTPSPGAKIDVLAPPPLDRVTELTENFRMPSDPLAGTVSAPTTTLTKTLRPKGDQITRIPPIPFTFFNPDTEQYVTRSTAAVPIKVKPASQLTMNAVVGNSGESGQSNSPRSNSANADLTEMA